MRKPIKLEKAAAKLLASGSLKALIGGALLAAGVSCIFGAGNDSGIIEGAKRQDAGMKLQWWTAIKKGIVTEDQAEKFYALDPSEYEDE